jgi:hypothetical protein
MSIIKAGHDEGAMQVKYLRLPPTQLQDGRIRADCGDTPVLNRQS